MVESNQQDPVGEQLAQDLQTQLTVEGSQIAQAQQPVVLSSVQSNDVALVSKLEDFCCSGEFTTFLSGFATQHASKFNYEEEEQSLECYQLWQNFKADVDVRLEEFIAAQPDSLTSEVIMESLIRLKDVDPGLLSCIDYLMAAADYQDFIMLMLDFRDVNEWQGDQDQQDDGQEGGLDAICEEENGEEGGANEEQKQE